MRIIFQIIFFLLFSYTTIAQNPYFEISKQIEIYDEVLKKLSTDYIDDINFGDLIQKNTKQMLNSLDRFTTFYDEQSILNQKMRQEGHFGGIGIQTQATDSVIHIIKIMKNTPAQKQGLLPGDKILKIEGKSIRELGKKTAQQMLSGEKGSKVKLEIKRNGKLISKKIERDDIPLDAVTATEIINDIGYIRFVKFNRKASSQVKKALLDLKSKGAKKIIIDVRGNPGGLLNEVVKIVNFFIPKGKVVVTTKGRFKKYDRTYSTTKESIDEKIPLAILANSHSASASEILSGSLQDYDRAVIIGDTTYGKGLVQRTYPLKYGTYMKQTISKYFIPSGRLIQKIDYWHRDKDGNPGLMKDYVQEKNYQTQNGRIVHNLGGIVPDIVISDKINNSLINDLINKNYLFEFVTNYYFNHSKPKDFENFKIDDQIINELIDFLKENKMEPKSESQILLEKAFKKARAEGDFKMIDAYKKLINLYQTQNLQNIKENKNLIKKLITNDLVQRYFYEEGLIKYQIKYDSIIKKAINILNNPNEYNKILKNN